MVTRKRTKKATPARRRRRPRPKPKIELTDLAMGAAGAWAAVRAATVAGLAPDAMTAAAAVAAVAHLALDAQPGAQAGATAAAIAMVAEAMYAGTPTRKAPKQGLAMLGDPGTPTPRLTHKEQEADA